MVDIDARPLVSLVEMAFYGSRVYELMSIQRPGDLLHYLWVTFVELDDALMKSLKESVDYKHPYEFDIKEAWTGLPFIYFDEKFFLQGDDTYPSDFAWRQHIDNDSWYQKLSSLYQLVDVYKRQPLYRSYATLCDARLLNLVAILLDGVLRFD